ncbi:MAG: ribosome maturation factor RimM [Armatimonadia bacterium]
MSNPTASEYDVQVGKVLGAHGLRGLLRVLPLTDVPGRHQTLEEVMVRTARTAQLYKVVTATPAPKGLWLVRLEGVSDRTQAETLKGAELFVRETDLPELPEGQYYIHQILGLRVITTQGRELGPITEVLPTGANDVYVTPAGLLPATDEVIKEVDLEAGTMIVDPLPGMIEEPADEDAD